MKKIKLTMTLAKFREMQKAAKAKGRKIRKPKSTEEQDLQIAIMDWARANEGKYPLLKWLNASMNGNIVGWKSGIKANRMGRKAGFPDLSLPVRTFNYLGLYIELKAANGKQSKEQKEWQIFLESQGYCYYLCNNLEQVQGLMLSYLTF